MNVFAKFDEIPSMILKVIKETKRYGHKDGRLVGRSDNVKTVYPPTNTVCGGYNNRLKNLPNARVANILLHEISHNYKILYIAFLQGLNTPHLPLKIQG